LRQLSRLDRHVGEGGQLDAERVSPEADGEGRLVAEEEKQRLV